MKKLFSLLFVALMFAACGGDGPETVVKKHMEAVFKVDIDEAIKYVNPESKRFINYFIEDINEQAQEIKSGKNKLISTSVVSKSDNKAKVKAVLEFNGEKISTDFKLTKINDTWYLDIPFH